MMDEVVSVHARAHAHETLFVIDSMAGQDAVNSAQAFNARLPLTGVILTKADGDAKGGVALSVAEITGKPIRFLGIGEKTDALELFHPDRMASRILGMGDVLSLVEEIEGKVDREHADKLAKKLSKGRGFDLADLRDQLQQMMKMGGMAAMLEKLPLAGKVNTAALKGGADERQLRRQVAIINSMTPAERAKPELLKASRKRRVAAGAGVTVQEVNQLLNQFEQTQKMMKMAMKGNMAKMMRGMKGMLPGMR
jgi:signal recognition particle subunit SRP54